MWRSGIQSVLLFLSVVISIAARADTPPSNPSRHEPQRVLFVCEHGSVKSLIAAEYFNQHAKLRGLPFVAMARGTSPAPVPEAVRTGLQAGGFDVAGFEPKPLTGSDVSGVSRVVSFDQDIGAIVEGRARYEQWDRLPAVSDNYERGRDAIVRRVDALIDELSTAWSLPP
jgi:arsenate reductase (thioredoxin)